MTELNMYTKVTTDSDVDKYYNDSLKDIDRIETIVKVNLFRLKRRLCLVYIMDLDNILKMALLCRVYECNLGQYSIKEIVEWIKDGGSIDDIANPDKELICDLDACLEYYEYKTGRSWYDNNNNERQDLEGIVVNAFKKLKGKCKYTIMTEDYNILFKP